VKENDTQTVKIKKVIAASLRCWYKLSYAPAAVRCKPWRPYSLVCCRLAITDSNHARSQFKTV